MNFQKLMEIYDDAFSPLYYMLLCALVVVYYDSKKTGKTKKAILVTILAYLIGISTYSLWFLVRSSFTPQWVEDILAVSGLSLALFIGYNAIRRKIYNGLVMLGILVLVTLTIPYAIISVFWNISGHVVYTTAPTLFLARINRKFFPLIAIPLLMVVNRPIVGAHSWSESVAGFILAAAITLYVTSKYKRLVSYED